MTLAADATGDVATWWRELSTTALVGTARRPLPDLPQPLGHGRPDAPREVGLLDAAALGSAVRHAGTRPGEPAPGTPAAEDRHPAPPPRATQLLELVLHQSPVGPALMPALLTVWLEQARATGHRAPHHLLPELLDLAGARAELRAGVRRVADTRGAWLAAANPAWAWFAADRGGAMTDDPATDPAEWARRPTPVRVGEVRRVRATRPAAARALVESTWGSDPAPDRVALLSALVVGLGPDDEPLLERALDDRAGTVREAALPLLDALPGSARAGRMAARLRPLLRPARGLLRRGLVEVELPSEPDAAGVRDGLGTPRMVGSRRGWWLQRLAAGAPLDVWTDASRADPATTWRMVGDQDARVGIVEAVLARRDVEWAQAIVVDVWHPRLLALVPAEDRDAVAAAQLARAATAPQVVVVVNAVPGPWGPAFSRAVLRRLAAEKEPTMLITTLLTALATGLDPVTRPALERWAATLDDTARERLGRVVQHLSLVPAITEAFS